MRDYLIGIVIGSGECFLQKVHSNVERAELSGQMGLGLGLGSNRGFPDEVSSPKKPGLKFILANYYNS